MSPGLIKLIDFVKKHGKNVARRTTGLQLCCEGMRVKVGFRLLLIRFHGSDEDGAEIGGRCRRDGRLGHRNTLLTARNRESINADGNRELTIETVTRLRQLTPSIITVKRWDEHVIELH